MRGIYWIKLVLLWAGIPLAAVFLDGILRIKFVSLNLSIALVCFVSYRKGPAKGAIMGLVTGFIEDNMGGIILGPSMLSRSLAGVLCTLLYDRMIIWNPVFSMLVVFLMSLVDDLVSYILLSLFVGSPYELGYFVGQTFIRALLTAPVGLLIKAPRHES